jgi:hypothetical protein
VPLAAQCAGHERAAPVVKSACILTDHSGESIVKQDRKLVHCGLPVIRSATPFGGDIAQREPN